MQIVLNEIPLGPEITSKQTRRKGNRDKNRGGVKFNSPFHAEACSAFTHAKQLYIMRPSARFLSRKHCGDKVVIWLQ